MQPMGRDDFMAAIDQSKFSRIGSGENRAGVCEFDGRLTDGSSIRATARTWAKVLELMPECVKRGVGTDGRL